MVTGTSTRSQSTCMVRTCVVSPELVNCCLGTSFVFSISRGTTCTSLTSVCPNAGEAMAHNMIARSGHREKVIGEEANVHSRIELESQERVGGGDRTSLSTSLLTSLRTAALSPDYRGRAFK